MFLAFLLAPALLQSLQFSHTLHINHRGALCIVATGHTLLNHKSPIGLFQGSSWGLILKTEIILVVCMLINTLDETISSSEQNFLSVYVDFYVFYIICTV